MEGMSETTITAVPRDNSKAPDQNGQPMQKQRSKSSVNLFRAALYLWGRKSSKKSKSSKSKSIHQVDNDIDAGCKFSLKGLVGSMRPMHLQGNQTPPPSSIKAKSKPPHPEQLPLPFGGYIEDANMLYRSPSTLSLSTYGSVSDMSSYGSVSDMSIYESPLHTLPDLRFLKPGEEVKATFWYGDDVDDYDNDVHAAGDDTIDAKAEEFIAQFYQQMRLQNTD